MKDFREKIIGSNLGNSVVNIIFQTRLTTLTVSIFNTDILRSILSVKQNPQ